MIVTEADLAFVFAVGWMILSGAAAFVVGYRTDRSSAVLGTFYGMLGLGMVVAALGAVLS